MGVIIFLLTFIFGCIVGSIVTAVICHPDKSFDEGYEAARERFTDHDKWFEEGWEKAKKYYKERLFEKTEKKGEEDDQT